MGRQPPPVIFNNIIIAYLSFFPEADVLKELYFRYLTEYMEAKGKDATFILKFMVGMVEALPDDEQLPVMLSDLINQNMLWIIDQLGVIDFFSKGRASLVARNECHTRFKKIQHNLLRLDKLPGNYFRENRSDETLTLFQQLVDCIQHTIEHELDAKNLRSRGVSFSGSFARCQYTSFLSRTQTPDLHPRRDAAGGDRCYFESVCGGVRGGEAFTH